MKLICECGNQEDLQCINNNAEFFIKIDEGLEYVHPYNYVVILKCNWCGKIESRII